ncbi:MAG: ORF6N domain-containing protein [Bacilli bacterium]|nr:ORF6N domain-containing protein [Bacilli bacterium]
MNELLTTENRKIENLIYEIRGKQVMLDSDLAKLYQCKNGTKEINQAVKNNPLKFPERFCFQLTNEELINLRSKFLTTNINNMSRSNPKVFTEQGVAMLATILKTKQATITSIAIMDAFVSMRHYILNNTSEQKYINKMVLKHDDEIKTLQNIFEKFKPHNNHIFYKNQIYDAYSLLLDIFNSSKQNIIIIDNYIDKGLLDLLSKTKKDILIITNKYNNEDYEKYKQQYSNIKIKISNSFHDRFIIIDNKILYHSGASFKDLGKKCFTLSKIDEQNILDSLIRKIH